jgi:hypothetical protein
VFDVQNWDNPLLEVQSPINLGLAVGGVDGVGAEHKQHIVGLFNAFVDVNLVVYGEGNIVQINPDPIAAFGQPTVEVDGKGFAIRPPVGNKKVVEGHN